MGEPYRTLLGHFRHECGHFYWDKLVRDGGKIDSCRAIFGDESENYEDALKRHYASGAPPTWQQEFVSAYATSHPWEDFAETFAHYLHIVDTLETARAFGLRTRPAVPDGDVLRAKIEFDPHRCRDINQIIDCLASAHLGDELHQSINGPARSLSVRAIAQRYRQTWLYRFDPCRVKPSSLGACLFPYRWNALQAERLPGDTVAEPRVGALLRAGLPNAVEKFRQRHLKLSHRRARRRDRTERA